MDFKTAGASGGMEMSLESAFPQSLAIGALVGFAVLLFFYGFKVIKKNTSSQFFRVCLYLVWFFVGSFAFGAYQEMRRNKRAPRRTTSTLQNAVSSGRLSAPPLPDLSPSHEIDSARRNTADIPPAEPPNPSASSSATIPDADEVKEYFRKADPFINELMTNSEHGAWYNNVGDTNPQVIQIAGNTFTVPCPRNSVLKMTENNPHSNFRNELTPFRYVYTFTDNVPGSENVRTLYHISYLSEHEELSSISYPLYLTFIKGIHETLEDGSIKHMLLQEFRNTLYRTLGMNITNQAAQNFELTGDYYSNAISGDIEYKGRETRLIESNVYFFHGNVIFHLSATDYASRSERESIDKVKAWMDEILKSNPAKQNSLSVFINGRRISLPAPIDSLPVEISPETSSEDYRPLAAFVEETNLYLIIFKLYHSREPVPPNSLESMSRNLAFGLRNSRNAIQDYFKNNPQYIAHRDPVILENSRNAFTNTQEVDWNIGGIPVRGYSLFSYFQLGNSFIQLRAICRYEQILGAPNSDLGEHIDYHAFRRIVAWRDAILSANE